MDRREDGDKGPISAATSEQHHPWFRRRLTLATAWGEGLDGYDLGLISVVLPSVTADLHAGSAWTGLIAASSLIGIFLGGPIVGRVTDRFGRRTPFTINLLAFVVVGVLQAFAPSIALLFVLRLLLGFVIGAEYAIGAPMLSEFVAAKQRGGSGAWLEVWWYGGFFVSVVVAYFMQDTLGLSWQLILATSALPALLTLALRRGLPESPRWLLSKGREDEAKAIVLEYVGDEDYYEREFRDEQAREGSLSDLLTPPYRGRLLMVCVFWSCLVAPYFAIVTFAPDIFGSLGFAESTSTIVENFIGVLGAGAGLLLMSRVGRRTLLIPPFWLCAVALIVVGIFPGAPIAVIGIAFVAFAFFNSMAADLCGVYPNELFPTELRTSGVGIAAASSRIGAAIGTFLLPIGLDTIGTGPSMLVGAGFCIVGGAVCQKWAPETSGKSLAEISPGLAAGAPSAQPAGA